MEKTVKPFWWSFMWRWESIHEGKWWQQTSRHMLFMSNMKHKMIISDGTIALSDLLKLLLLLTSFTMQIACFISLHFCLINVLFSELKTYLWLCAHGVKYVFPSHLDAMDITLWCDVTQVFKMTKHRIIIRIVLLQNAHWLPLEGRKCECFSRPLELSYFSFIA